jgi:undecaprenyl-diphosphatase
MNLIQTIIIAIVEGVTEFLPISSTGHMIIVQKLLGVPADEFVKSFTVIIQFGAILSVLVLYWRRFLQSLDFYWKLLVAFLPAAVFGFLLNDVVDSLLENVTVVAISLLLGGVLMIFVDKWFNSYSEINQEMTWGRSLKIGFFQCIAMIPGVSRSMVTIVGGMSTKLTRKNAAEFSFFLAVPTMAAATGYKLLKLVKEPSGMELIKSNAMTLLVGNAVAFVVAMISIKFFISYLTKYGFKAFGYYRIVVGVLILVLLAMGYDLKIM